MRLRFANTPAPKEIGGGTLGRDLSSELLPNYPSADFQRLVESDTIIVGTINYSLPVATKEGALATPRTDYHVAVVIRQKAGPAIAAGDTVIARRLGGTTTRDGFRITTMEVGFPPFSGGETYVLFLASEPNEAHFTFPYGPQNAFLITPENNVTPVSRDPVGVWNRERGVVSLSAFLDEVQELISASR